MDFSTALEGYWLARRRDFSEHTVSDYGVTFRRFAEFAGARPVDGIGASEINAFLNLLRDRHKLGNKSLANAWAALSSFFTWAETELRIAHPMRGVVKRPEWRRPEIRAYTKPEILAMLSATEQTASWRTRNGRRTSSKRPTALRDRTILVVLIDTGIRASELCDLRLRDYEPETGRVVIRQGKGGKSRTVYVGQAAQRQLWRYITSRGAIRSNDPIFVTRNDRSINRDELLNMVTATARRAGVSGANVHRFRHTYAITFLRNGGNVLELQRLLGHERMDTLRIYVELAQMDLANAQAAASPADNWGL